MMRHTLALKPGCPEKGTTPRPRGLESVTRHPGWPDPGRLNRRHVDRRKAHMAGFAVARLEEIDEVDDGRCPFRPVRHHFGIATFGVNAMIAPSDGDRLINEHQEAEPESGEELYVVISGHATFDLDGETQDAPMGTF